MEYQAHELSLAFPDMPTKQFKRLCADIKANGLLHPVVLYEDRILDGRHRHMACIKTDTVCRFEQYTGDDPVAYVTSENAARRHLTTSQIAHAVAAMAGWEREKAKKRQVAYLKKGVNSSPALIHANDADSVERGRTGEILASKAGVSRDTVNRAIKVREKGTESLNKKVASGDITVNEAEKISGMSTVIQERLVAIEDKRERGAELAEAMNRSKAAKARRERERAPKQPKEDNKPKFCARFIGRLRMLQSGVRDDLGISEATADDIASAVLAELDESDMQSLEVVLPLLEACALIRDSKVAKTA